MLLILISLWFIWELKYILFWLYLWQLKEYHFGRFIDHFRTHKGKRVLFNFTQGFKLILFFLLLSPSLFFYTYYILIFVYFLQATVFLRSLFAKSIKRPVWTKKIIFLSLVSFVAGALLLLGILPAQNFFQVSWLLTFDILTPIIISLIVLLFQPAFVALRNKTLRQATEKMDKIRSVSGLTVIAITGSYGKTSTKEFLSTILSKKYKVLSTKDHQNSEIGIAKCILDELKPSHQIFIAEVGAYNKGKVKEVCRALKPKIGIVTGVNEQHMALFGSMQNLLLAEGGGELAECLSRYNRGSSTESGQKDGMLIVNGDSKYCLELLKKSNNLPESQEKIYTTNNKAVNAAIWSDGVEVYRDYISFLATSRKGNLAHFDVKVLGKQNVQNILGAILVANELGMSFEEISEASKDIKQEQAGMTLRRGKHGIDVIDSSYSANPDGVVADLDYLSAFPGKKIIVMPCLIELGKKSPEIHVKLGRKIGEVCDLAIITSKDQFEDIKKGASEIGSGNKIIFIENPNEIFSKITTFCKSGDAVLLEGRVPSSLVKFLIG
ncbi:MAG: UDP-N-acetylmuramoyl-tripeptide--D-alanyl-D-alanine ligase [bacterium]